MQAKPAGRPRKVSREKIIASALVVMETNGYTSLSWRALAREMGVNHATLYNYFDDIDEVEREALNTLTAGITIPSGDSSRPLRYQLIEHFLCIRQVQLLYPKFCHAPAGSKKWQIQMQLLVQVVDAVCSDDSQVQNTIIGYNALFSVVAQHAERTRTAGRDAPIMSDIEAMATLPKDEFATFFRQLESGIDISKEIVSLPYRLNYLIDKLLPEMPAIPNKDIDELRDKFLSN